MEPGHVIFEVKPFHDSVIQPQITDAILQYKFKRTDYSHGSQWYLMGIRHHILTISCLLEK